MNKFEPLQEGHFEYIKQRTGRTDREELQIKYKEWYDNFLKDGIEDPESNDNAVTAFHCFILDISPRLKISDKYKNKKIFED